MIYTVTFNPAIDYVVRLTAPLQPGALQRAAAEEYQYGGKGINVSTMLTRLGVPTTALGFVAGQTGTWLQNGLAQQGVAADFIALPEGMTRINVKVKAGAGQQVTEETELNGRGPQITPQALQTLQQKLAAIGPGDLLVLSGSIPAGMPADSYRQLMAPLCARGVRVAVDASGPLLRAVLPLQPFLIKPNHHELGELFGQTLSPQDRPGIAACARALQAEGARNVLVSLGPDGAFLRTEQGEEFWCPAPQGTLVNSVGAGDSMLAGFLAGYCTTGSCREALHWGVACGSATAFSAGIAAKAEVDAQREALRESML